MRVYVRLFATLACYLPGVTAGVTVEVELPEGASIEAMLTRLGVPLEEVHMVFVNGRARPLPWTLQPGDEVGAFPPIGGG